MAASLTREFRLSPPGSDRGVCCDANGAFVDSILLLKRLNSTGLEGWEPRDSDELSRDLSSRYGLPIDLSSKSAGLRAIASSLNTGDIARAQIGALLLRIP